MSPSFVTLSNVYGVYYMVVNTSISTTNLIKGSSNIKMSCTAASGIQQLSSNFTI